MDTQDKLYIKDLTTRTKRGYLCIRVMRKWNYDGNIPGGPVIYIGLVLADEQANAIYAQIPQSDVDRLGSALMVDEVYTIRKFSVRISRGNYVPFDAELMIQMTSFTTVTPSKVPRHVFPKLIYNITPFKDIQTAGQGATRYIDVLGIITSEQPAKTTYIKGRDQMSTLKEVTIKDLSGHELTVTLWEACVERFKLEDACPDGPIQSIVVLFCGCLPKKIFKKTQVNAGNACSWVFNPAIEEAQPLYASLQNQPVVIDRPPPSTPAGDITGKPRVVQHKTIADMNAMDPYAFPEEGCKCTVTIIEFAPDQEWWYMGCEVCKKRLWNYGGNYHCVPCKCSTAIPLYKVQFTAADDSGEAKFFCYDVVARQIIRRNCDSLLRAINNAAGLPQQMLNAVGKEFVFTVGLTDQSYRSMQTRVYLVDSCTAIPQLQPPQSLPTISTQSRPRALMYHGPTTSSPTSGQQIDPSEKSKADAAGTHQAIGIQTPQQHESGSAQPASAPDLTTLEMTPPPTANILEAPVAEKTMIVGDSSTLAQKQSTARKRLTYDETQPQEIVGGVSHDQGMEPSNSKKIKVSADSRMAAPVTKPDAAEHMSRGESDKAMLVKKQ